MKSGAKFILAMFGLLALLGGWLGWMSKRALDAKREASPPATVSPSSPAGTPDAP